jgi:hypothetical protein
MVGRSKRYAVGKSTAEAATSSEAFDNELRWNRRP